jgi:hypothetical protein
LATVSDDLDRVQKKLHDGGVLWPRTELLRWYRDGYRLLLADSGAVRRFRPLDIPGRHAYGLTYEWEDGFASGGTVRKPSRSTLADAYQATGLWEVEQLHAMTPTAALTGFTQEWERAHFSGDSDRHFRFSFPRNHQRVARLEWKNRRLWPVSVRELDESDTTWITQIGEPRWWTTGAGRVRSVELYEISTTYGQAYGLLDALSGLPRRVSGSRTYAVAYTPEPPVNAYAYTTAGDAQALTTAGSAFGPAACYTASFEKPFVETPTTTVFNCGVNLTMNYPATTGTVMHPWEYDFLGGPALPSDPTSPGMRGLFAWERLDPAKAFETSAHGSDGPLSVSGLGHRITTPSSTTPSTFAVHAWERQQLDGATLTASALIGGFRWEEQHGAQAVVHAVGTVRRVLSPDRQYLPLVADLGLLGGRLSDWRSSEDSVLALEVVLPDVDLGEADTPAMIPAPLQKYLRYHVLSRAFGRPGEGRRSILADHYGRRARRGVELFRRLGDIAHQDHVFVRDAVVQRDSRPPRVRLPAEFPSVS